MSQSLDNAIRSLQQLKVRVETMPPGGDLENLIEEGLAQVGRGCYEMCLDARRQSACVAPPSETEGFPPSGVSRVRRAVAARGDSPSAGCDSLRRGEL
jgi:hypothetical protein